jgi:uncharacterized membrane protein
MDFDFGPIREIAFSPNVLWILWGLMFIVWVVMSAILLYHWNSYSTADPRVKRMKLTYLIGGLLLFASATTFIFSL